MPMALTKKNVGRHGSKLDSSVLAAPPLVKPELVILDDATIKRRPEVHLRGVNKDWIIMLPRSEYLQNGFSLDGCNEARNIVLIGGGIRPTSRYNPADMQLLDGRGWALFALRGFSGASGGSFRFRVQERSYIKDRPPRETRDLPWDATPGMVASALEEIAGEGSVFAVDGPTSPGGPWKIVPSARPLLGRPVLIGTGLRGEITYLQRNSFRAAAAYGLRVKNWLGTFHCEGVHITGSAVCDGINVENPNADAVAQFKFVHSSPGFHVFHDDWIHGDGAQFYLGPSCVRMEDVDLVSLGGNGFIAQPFQLKSRPLQNLRQWSFKRCHFRSIKDTALGREADASASLFRAHDRSLARPKFDQSWLMNDVYLSRLSSHDGQSILAEEPQHCYMYTGPDELTAKLYSSPSPEFFADPRAARCGPTYTAVA